MKTPNFVKLALGLTLAGLPFAGGCLQQSNTQPGTQAGALTAPAAEAVPVAYAQPAPPTATAAQEPASMSNIKETEDAQAMEEGTAPAPPLEELVNAQVQPVSMNQPVPAKIQLSGPAAELVKLAGSGVDQSVMLAYVTNSHSLFNLGAEEIIYMNDIGVPSAVVTAMIQKDQALKAEGLAALTAQSQPVQSVPASVAPAPAPGDVAPQATAPLTPPVTSEPPPPVAPAEAVSYDTFYDSLAPYGTWVYVAGYGRCWRPSAVVANPGWQPYFDGGHWVYTDAGWYWMSDYSWGWAPFHYGRWFRHGAWGWCWAPDVVWGPSWVAWRQSVDYCGWAPLPPGAYFSFSIGLTFHGHPVHHWEDCGLGPNHYRFVSWRHFDDRHVHAYGLPHHQVTQVYNNTVVVNNITVNNHTRTVVNHGVPRERVAEATRHDIKPVSIRTTTTTTTASAAHGSFAGDGRAERLSGNTLTVYKPAINNHHTSDGGRNMTNPFAAGHQNETANSAPGARSTGYTKPARQTENLAENQNRTAPQNRPPVASPQQERSTPPLYRPANLSEPSAPQRTQVSATKPYSPNTIPPGKPQKPVPSPAAPANTASTYKPPQGNPTPWRNTDPNTRTEQIQPQQAYMNNSQPAYQSQPVPQVPMARPAQNYTPQRTLEVPRYNANAQSYIPQPHYTATPQTPQRNFTQPTYTAPAKPAPSYEGQRAAPAQSAMRAPSPAPQIPQVPPPTQSSRNENNGGGNSRRQQ